MKTTAIAFALLTAGLVTVQAKPPGHGKLTAFLRIFDLDDNGVLDEEELQEAKAALKRRAEDFIAKWDADGNGKLSFAEIRVARKSILAKIEAKRLDKFNDLAGEDGLISAEEFAANPAFADKDPERVTALFNSLDRNDDGSLSFVEFKRKFRKYPR